MRILVAEALDEPENPPARHIDHISESASQNTLRFEINADILKKMPYVLVSTIFNDENSPTVVGDSSSDPALMRILDAEKVKEYRKRLPEYRVWNHVRVVLDKLEEEGYSVISMTTVEKTIVWCLHKPYLTENLHMKDQLPEIL